MYKSRFRGQFLEIRNNSHQKRNQGRSANIYRFHDNNERKHVLTNLVDANKLISTICYALPHAGGIY